jgi:DNA-binding PadR family transcriptional regulator
MSLDRNLQRRMLKALEDKYPSHDTQFTRTFEHETGYMPNLHYLKEHGLLTGAPTKTSHDLLNIKITAAGLDFLADDGGISAILRTVTVKLDAEQFRQMLTAKVASLSLEEEKKSSILGTIRSLPGEVLNKLAIKLIEKGVEHDFLEILRWLSPSSSSGLPPTISL